jgi:uncharacterized membrane protein YuzA (DUF378 family)
MKALQIIAAVLVIIGAINWGLVGAFNVNLVALLFGSTIFSSIVYTLVGLAGVLHIWSLQSQLKSQPSRA